MSLESIFESLTLQSLNDFIERQQVEHLQLEFKTITDVNFSRPDRRNLAIMISGFSNSSGGLIVWGIDARPNQDGIDGATLSPPITPLNRFFVNLNNFSSMATSPSVDGVKHKMIEASPDQGYVVTLVPESTAGPHMAKLGEDRYYKRNGSSFYNLEHFDLEDMFGRRQRPDLQVFAKTPNQPAPENQELIEISIMNLGKAVGKHLGFFAELHGGIIIDSTIFNNISSMNVGRQAFSYENNSNVFHPNDINIVLGSIAYRRESPAQIVTLTIKFYCEHMKPKKSSFTFLPIDTPPSPEVTAAV